MAVPLLVITLASSAHAGSQVWTGTGPRARSIEALARDPLNGSRMWAASFGAGVYRSLDGGATWAAYRTGLTNTYVRCLAVNPIHPDSVYCGTNDGVFGSVNGGVNWTPVLSTAVSVRSLTIQSNLPRVIYAGTNGEGIYKSVNGGATWSTTNLGLANVSVRDIALLPTQPDLGLFAATGTGGGVERSSNGGLTWAPVSDSTARLGAAEQIQIDAQDPQRIYVDELTRGVLRSTDGGTSWSTINRGLPDLQTRSLAVLDTLRYVGTLGAGVFTTTLHDTIWHPGGPGPEIGAVDALLAFPSNLSKIWAGTDGGGIYASANRGVTWSQLDGGLLSTSAFSLAVRPATHRVYAGLGFGDQAWRSGDGAATWTRAAYLFTHDSEHGIVADPLAPSTVYLSAYGAGVYRSLDDGATWSNPDSTNGTLANTFVRPLVAWPGQSGHLLVGSGIGPFESTDGGVHWTSRVGNLPPSFGVHALALNPGTPATMFAGNDLLGLYRSTNGGGTWLARNAGMPIAFVHVIVLDPVTPTTVYAATDSGVFRSLNNGDLWARASAGLPAGSVRALTLDPTHVAVLFAGIYGQGVFETVNGGVSWFPLAAQSGLVNRNVRALALDPGVNTLYAGTEAGVEALTSYPLAAVGVEPSPIDAVSLAAAPNPMRPSGRLAVRFAYPGRVPARLAIYTAGGRQVRVAKLDPLPAGDSSQTGTWTWDGIDDAGRATPAGVYFISLRAGPAHATTRFVRLAR
ncbi:MAG: hypothetical protein ABI960_00980 [Candidatus Eisenbacteria bacterium]